MPKPSINLRDAIFQVSDGVLGAGVLIFLGVVAGNFLDGKLHTAPAFTVALSLLGGAFGLGRLVKKAMLVNQSLDSDTKAPGGSTDVSEDTPTESLRPLPSSASADEQLKPKQPKEPKPKSAFEFLDHDEP